MNQLTPGRLLSSLILVCLSGCSYGLHPHRTIEGYAFPWDRVAEIKPGTTQAQLALELGPPLEATTEGPNAEVWRYYEQAQLQGCRRSLFGVIPLGDTPVVTRGATVHLRGGVVERVEVSGRR
jgi:outer membrane protein assembly factor BamE (lipoprotein component of BamABCDE complex)